MKDNKLPKRIWAIVILSISWLMFGAGRWIFYYHDYSNFTFVAGFFFIGLYIAYDQWYKHKVQQDMGELKLDIQAIDTKCNNLENKIIELGERR